MKIHELIESVATLSHRNPKYTSDQAAELKNMKKQILQNYNKELNADIFDGKKRIYIPLLDIEEPPITNTYDYSNALAEEDDITMKYKGNEIGFDDMETMFDQINDIFETNGYEMVDYRKNKAITYSNGKSRNTSISSILAKNNDLLQFYNNDPIRTGAKLKNKIVAISRHPHDIGAMSTNRSWDSCMNLIDGANKKFVPLDISHGTIVAYLIDKADRKIEKPTARLAIKPFKNMKNENEIALGAEGVIYGQSSSVFKETVLAWLEKANSHLSTGVYRKDYNLYSDTHDENQDYLLVNPNYLPGSIEDQILKFEIQPKDIPKDKMTMDLFEFIVNLHRAHHQSFADNHHEFIQKHFNEITTLGAEKCKDDPAAIDLYFFSKDIIAGIMEKMYKKEIPKKHIEFFENNQVFLDYIPARYKTMELFNEVGLHIWMLNSRLFNENTKVYCQLADALLQRGNNDNLLLFLDPQVLNINPKLYLKILYQTPAKDVINAIERYNHPYNVADIYFKKYPPNDSTIASIAEYVTRYEGLHLDTFACVPAQYKPVVANVIAQQYPWTIARFAKHYPNAGSGNSNDATENMFYAAYVNNYGADRVNAYLSKRTDDLIPAPVQQEPQQPKRNLITWRQQELQQQQEPQQQDQALEPHLDESVELKRIKSLIKHLNQK